MCIPRLDYQQRVTSCTKISVLLLKFRIPRSVFQEVILNFYEFTNKVNTQHIVMRKYMIFNQQLSQPEAFFFSE